MLSNNGNVAVLGAPDAMPQVLTASIEKAVYETFNKINFDVAICEHDDDVTGHDGIVGIISFVGDMTWSLMMGLPREAAETIALKFAGFEIPFDSCDMVDVIGELANVLAGVACGQLEAAGQMAHMSLPTVARGHDVELMMPGDLISERLYFSMLGVCFWVKIVMAKRR